MPGYVPLPVPSIASPLKLTPERTPQDVMNVLNGGYY